jgi:hypothetical protein
MAARWSTNDLAKVYARQGLKMPEALQAACGEGGEKRSKYNIGQDAGSRARRTVDGILFASAKEARAYVSLKIAQERGLIADLELQPRFLLQAAFRDEHGKKHRKIEYVADFQFLRCFPDHMPDERVVVDTKGVATQVWRLKEKLFRARYSYLKLEIW